MYYTVCWEDFFKNVNSFNKIFTWWKSMLQLFVIHFVWNPGLKGIESTSYAVRPNQSDLSQSRPTRLQCQDSMPLNLEFHAKYFWNFKSMLFHPAKVLYFIHNSLSTLWLVTLVFSHLNCTKTRVYNWYFIEKGKKQILSQISIEIYLIELPVKCCLELKMPGFLGPQNLKTGRLRASWAAKMRIISFKSSYGGLIFDAWLVAESLGYVMFS